MVRVWIGKTIGLAVGQTLLTIVAPIGLITKSERCGGRSQLDHRSDRRPGSNGGAVRAMRGLRSGGDSVPRRQL